MDHDSESVLVDSLQGEGTCLMFAPESAACLSVPAGTRQAAAQPDGGKLAASLSHDLQTDILGLAAGAENGPEVFTLQHEVGVDRRTIVDR